MPLVPGKGVKADKAEKRVRAVPAGLADGEEILFICKCNNLRPVTEAIVVTNARVAGFSPGMQAFKFAVLFDEIVATTYDAKAKKVRVEATDGRDMTFKTVAPEDVPVVQEFIERGRAAGVPEPLADAVREVVESGKKPTAEDELEQYGRKLTSDMFGGNMVSIYEKGYVKVSLPLLGSLDSIEKLLAVEATSDVSKKTGLGRGIGAVATLGVNLMGSNKRGDVYLTVRTDARTHVLHEDPPTATNLKTVKKLEAIGRSVIASAEHAANVPAAPAAERSIGERLQELAALRDGGLITEDEHQEQRTRLLGDL